MLDRYKERNEVERRKNPVGHWPPELRTALIHGDDEAYTQAREELRVWCAMTGKEILEAEMEFIWDARAQVGFGAEQERIRKLNNPGFVRKFLNRFTENKDA